MTALPAHAICEGEDVENAFEIVERLQTLVDSGNLTSFRTYLRLTVPDTFQSSNSTEQRIFADGVIVNYNSLQQQLLDDGIICLEGNNEKLLTNAIILGIGNETYPQQDVITSDITYSAGGNRHRRLDFLKPDFDGLQWDGDVVNVFLGLEGACDGCPLDTVCLCL
ncbi:MAG: hypothetical protein SGARI_003157 [Bacillariaceae sp.]